MLPHHPQKILCIAFCVVWFDVDVQTLITTQLGCNPLFVLCVHMTKHKQHARTTRLRRHRSKDLNATDAKGRPCLSIRVPSSQHDGLDVLTAQAPSSTSHEFDKLKLEWFDSDQEADRKSPRSTSKSKLNMDLSIVFPSPMGTSPCTYDELFIDELRREYSRCQETCDGPLWRLYLPSPALGARATHELNATHEPSLVDCEHNSGWLPPVFHVLSSQN